MIGLCGASRKLCLYYVWHSSTLERSSNAAWGSGGGSGDACIIMRHAVNKDLF